MKKKHTRGFMKKKHTQGPWKIVKSWDDWLVVAGDDCDDIIFQDGPYNTPAIKEQNARLIASAPTMLETLENTAEVIENLLEKVLPKDDQEREVFLNSNDEFLQLTGTLSDINNTIDKAKGDL